VPGFWQWYYSQAINKAMLIYQSIVLLTYDFFSIPLLIRTLFYPWKKDEVAPTTPSLQLLIQAFWMNMIVRFLGAIIRSIMIVFGLFSIAVIMILGVLGIIYAATLPISATLSFVGGLLLISSKNPSSLLIGIFLLAFALLAVFIAIKSWLSDRQNDVLPKKKLSAWVDGEDPNIWLSTAVKVLLSELNNFADIKNILVKKQEIIFILNRLGIYSKEITAIPLDPKIDLKITLNQAAKIAQSRQNQMILMSDVFLSLAELDPSIKPILVNYSLTIDDLSNVANWQVRLWKMVYAPSQLLDPKNLRFSGGIGKDWAAGYTNYLDRFARELNIVVSNSYYDYQFVAHTNQIENMERILARSGKHNVLLVGETGVGKKTTVLGLARRVLIGRTLAPLRYKRLIELDISALLTSDNTTNELETNLIHVLNEAVRAGNVILFINGIERLLQNADSAGSINVGELLIPYLKSNQFQLLATIPPAQYQSIIARQPTLESLFEKVDIVEPDNDSTLIILEDIARNIEAHYNVIVTYEALRRVVQTATRYLPTLKFPEKGIDLLDEVAANVATDKKKDYIASEDVDKIISQKTNIPVGEAETNEKEKLLNLEDLMHKRVVNQTVAIGQISNALRRSRAGVGNEKKPIGSFLFLGPTGVGKTETAKALAEIYFGSEKNMLRLDMSEFQEISSIESLIGDVNQGVGGRLTDGIRQNPFTCILLDEIEKAHPKILDIFLQVLDEGRLTDALGQVADFRNAIIIATSNAGAQWLKEAINQAMQEQNPANNSQIAIDMEKISKELIEEVQRENLFRPEFLNRFDSVTAFRPLTAKELEQVVDFQLAILNKRLATKQITVSLNPEAKTKLAQIGFNPEFGARALTRTMVEVVENKVAQALLKNEIANGGTFEITPEMVQ
jgi:ATP-dependent Clp protease ATP-binding subunit ClpC